MNNHGYDEKLAEIVSKFAEYKDTLPPSSPAAMKLVMKWQQYLSKNHYEVTDELLEALGRMYAENDFAPKIDVFGKGTALYMSRAIAEYCKK